MRTLGLAVSEKACSHGAYGVPLRDVCSLITILYCAYGIWNLVERRTTLPSTLPFFQVSAITFFMA